MAKANQEIKRDCDINPEPAQPDSWLEALEYLDHVNSHINSAHAYCLAQCESFEVELHRRNAEIEELYELILYTDNLLGSIPVAQARSVFPKMNTQNSSPCESEPSSPVTPVDALPESCSEFSSATEKDELVAVVAQEEVEVGAGEGEGERCALAEKESSSRRKLSRHLLSLSKRAVSGKGSARG